MTSNAMRIPRLPLQGSNLDSPDPESGATPPSIEGAATESAGFVQGSATGPTKSPTIPHTLLYRGVDVVQGRCVIYGLVDPNEPDRVRYVGKSGNPHARLCQRLAGRPGTGEPVRQWIAQLRSAGRMPDMVLLEDVAPGGWARELAWYEILRAIGQADCNDKTPHHRPDFPEDPRPISAKRRREIEAEKADRAHEGFWREVFANSDKPDWSDESTSPLILDEINRHRRPLAASSIGEQGQ